MSSYQSGSGSHMIGIQHALKYDRVTCYYVIYRPRENSWCLCLCFCACDPIAFVRQNKLHKGKAIFTVCMFAALQVTVTLQRSYSHMLAYCPVEK